MKKKKAIKTLKALRENYIEHGYINHWNDEIKALKKAIKIMEK